LTIGRCLDSFLSAVHHFTGIRIPPVAARPIDTATLAWTPIVGLLAAILAISFYVPLGEFYLPMDVAVIPTLVAICWLRGFKPEIDFCNLCDSIFDRRKRASARSLPGVPGITCLIFATLFKYAIVRQFFFWNRSGCLLSELLLALSSPCCARRESPAGSNFLAFYGCSYRP
jgi:hypothetical protein